MSKESVKTKDKKLQHMNAPIENELCEKLRFLAFVSQKSIKDIISEALEDHFKQFPFLKDEKNIF